MLLKYIEQIHADSRGAYGPPRVHAKLTLGLGLRGNHERAERLMREVGIQGLYRRRRSRTAIPGPDLINRQFTADAPARLWITDLAEHPTEDGNIYYTELVTETLGMAILRRNPENTTFRSRLAVRLMGIQATPPGSQPPCPPEWVRSIHGINHSVGCGGVDRPW